MLGKRKEHHKLTHIALKYLDQEFHQSLRKLKMPNGFIKQYFLYREAIHNVSISLLRRINYFSAFRQVHKSILVHKR